MLHIIINICCLQSFLTFSCAYIVISNCGLCWTLVRLLIGNTYMILKNVWFAFSLLSYNLFIALPDLSHILVNLYCAKNILQIVCMMILHIHFIFVSYWCLWDITIRNQLNSIDWDASNLGCSPHNNQCFFGCCFYFCILGYSTTWYQHKVKGLYH